MFKIGHYVLVGHNAAVQREGQRARLKQPI